MFYVHELEAERVMNEGAWAFEQKLIVINRFDTSRLPSLIPMSHTDIWIQVFDLPIGFWTTTNIGNCVGNFVKADPKSFDGFWKAYMRIRVSLDISKPLKTRMKMKRPGVH